MQALGAVQYDENELKRQMKAQIDEAIKGCSKKPASDSPQATLRSYKPKVEKLLAWINAGLDSVKATESKPALPVEATDYMVY